jgi:cellulose synthase/poly-beta-1,6-N-acetylglucosamine synthase-like glycosyltransferase
MGIFSIPEKFSSFFSVTRLFFLLFLIVFLLLNILVGVFMVNFYDPLAIVALIVLELVNMIIAYRTSEFFLSLFVHSHDLPKIVTLKKYPPVALLYVTYNDAIPEIIAKLDCQTYPNYRIFILDDSTDPKSRAIVDNFSYPILRREHRNGFKAGAINNWLDLHGLNFKYFVIFDSDSIVGEDFIENLVKYGEHPLNNKIAVFQTKWRIWNTHNFFPRIIASLYPLWFYSFEKLANHYETPLIMGHNNLTRTDAVLKVNGFDEEYVCEDLAISLKLMENGWDCKYVDMLAFEACPESIYSYARRTIRWGKGTLEVAKKGTRNISFMSNFHLFMTAFFYLIYLCYLPGMLIVTWSYTSSINDAVTLVELIISGDIIYTKLFHPMVLIFVYFFIFFLLRLPLAYKLKISLKNYFLGMILLPAIDLYMLLPMVRGLINTLSGQKVFFNVTDKTARQGNISQLFHEMGAGTILWLILILGVIRNPISLVFNFFWLLPFIFSPVILYSVSKIK